MRSYWLNHGCMTKRILVVTTEMAGATVPVDSMSMDQWSKPDIGSIGSKEDIYQADHRFRQH